MGCKPSSKAPRVTVAVPAYNHQNYVGATLDSCALQAYPNFEVHVIDDGSTDGTAAVCAKKAAQHACVRFESQKNVGLVRTLNRMLEETSAKYIECRSSDDLFTPDKTLEQVRYMEAHPEVGGVYSYVVTIDPRGRPIPGIQGIVNQPRSNDELVAQQLRMNILVGPSVMLRVSTVREIGLWDTSYLYATDYEYWLRLILHSKVAVVPKILTAYRTHGANMHKKSPGQCHREVARLLQVHGPAILARYPHLGSARERLYPGVLDNALLGGDWLLAEQMIRANLDPQRPSSQDLLYLMQCRLAQGDAVAPWQLLMPLLSAAGGHSALAQRASAELSRHLRPLGGVGVGSAVVPDRGLMAPGVQAAALPSN